MVSDLTGLPMSNASLLDEATAAAEAMFLTYNIAGKKKDHVFFVSVSTLLLVFQITSYRRQYCYYRYYRIMKLISNEGLKTSVTRSGNLILIEIISFYRNCATLKLSPSSRLVQNG